jgi:prepilin peptidase CpaA
MLEATILVVLPFCMAFAALSDLFTMTIANRVSLLLVATFAIIAPFTGMDMMTYGMHFAVAGGVLVLTFALFAYGGFGGGDAKLLTAIALWCGYSQTFTEYLIYAALFGGWLTLGLVFYRGTTIAEYAGARFEFLERLGRKEVGVPYGIALGAAALVVAPSMPLVAWAIERAAI